MVLAGPGLTMVSGTAPASRRDRRALTAAALACALSLAVYLADLHRPGQMLDWYDLNVYNHAGLITRPLPRQLYTWQLTPGIKFTYTPFASLVFAAGSLLPWVVLKWLMTLASLTALAGTVWFTLGGLGWRGRRKVTAMLALAAAALWFEPVFTTRPTAPRSPAARGTRAARGAPVGALSGRADGRSSYSVSLRIARSDACALHPGAVGTPASRPPHG
jgi:hypothetical protein